LSARKALRAQRVSMPGAKVGAGAVQVQDLDHRVEAYRGLRSSLNADPP
jgi:hypothetical protein